MKAEDTRGMLPVMPGADEAYRRARERLHAAERALRDQIESVAAMRRELPQGPIVPDYEFLEGEKRVKLSELFTGEKNELVIYHLMYWADDDDFCPMCSMWIDGLDAVAPHVEQRANFAVASRASGPRLRDWANRRGWRRARLLSDVGSDFARDMGAESGEGEPIETVAVFTKDGDEIRNSYLAHAFMFDEWRFIDLLSPVWQMFDLLRAGRDDWHPTNEYIREPAERLSR